MKKSMSIMLIVVFMLGVASTAFAGPFADIPANNWAYGAVNQLAKAGLIDGYGDGAFRGDKTVTRYEMAILIGKALEHADKADAANKALLDKLTTEYAQELNTLGVRVSTVEAKVNNLERIQISGSEQLWIRSVNDSATPKAPLAGKTTYGDNQFLLNFNMKVQDNISVFARFGERNFFGTAVNYNFSDGDGGRSSANLDHFGVKVNAGDWDLSVGRQAVMLGQGTIINTGTEFGFNPHFAGLIAKTTFDNVTMHVIGGHTNPNANTDAITSSAYNGANWYGTDASVKVGENVTLGAAYAHENYLDNYLPNCNYTSLNAAINFGGGPFTLIAETEKSSADTLNKAWQLTAVYHQDKDTFVLMHVNTQKNAIDQYTNIQQGGYQFALGASLSEYPQWHGNLYKWLHDLTPTVQSTVMVITDAVNGVSGQNVEGVAGFTFKF
jgi:hypothetical protein